MTIEEIIFKTADLNRRLNKALTTMERNDEVFNIRKEIKEIQAQCPHGNEKYHWDVETKACPYCGFKRSE